jgi:hypothetical protein
MKLYRLTLIAAMAAALCGIATAQKLPPVTIDIAVANGALYLPDTADYSKYGTLLGPVMPAAAANGLSFPNFTTYVEISDVVSVNGDPAKGTLVNQGRFLQLSPTPRAGQTIADSGWYTIASVGIDVLTAAGVRVGTVYTSGFALGAPPPGAPAGYSGLAVAVQGGTGAFVGATGQITLSNLGARAASIMEDPANRRNLGGQPDPAIRHLLVQLIPAVRPEIEAVYHADFTPVTADKPGQKGETLIALCTGLGPTRPAVDFGQPFPPYSADPLYQVSSPVSVNVNGEPVKAINAIGWPGLVDAYRVDFQVPGNATSGPVAIQLTAAWIPGHSVIIPAQ